MVTAVDSVGAVDGAPTLRVSDLGTRYGSRWVFRHVSFTLGRGLIGLLGPNGAGKTTLLMTIASLRAPNEGRVTLVGSERADRSVADELGQLGYLSQAFTFVPRFTAREFVEYSLWLKGVRSSLLRSKSLEALERVGVSAEAGQQMRRLSGGTRQRVGLAAALAHDPRLVVLDEPTVGLDPGQRLAFRRLLQELASERTILLSTHIVEDVMRVSNRVLVLASGRIAFDGTPAALEAVARCGVAGEAMSRAEAGYAAILEGEARTR